MKKYLFKYQDNWADEIDIDGSCVLDEEELNKFLIDVEKFQSDEFYIGTNEEIHYGKVCEIKDCFSYEEISEQEFKVLEKLDLLNEGFASSFIEFVRIFKCPICGQNCFCEEDIEYCCGDENKC